MVQFMKEESLVIYMWKNNMVVTQNDTQASRSGKCRHLQNEPKLRSHNITEPYTCINLIGVLDVTIYEIRIICHLNVEQ